MDRKYLESIEANIEQGDELVSAKSYNELVQICQSVGISIESSSALLLQAKAKKVAIPALNVRLLTKDFAKMICNLIHEKGLLGVIFELAPTESKYTSQPYQKFCAQILLGALSSKYRGKLYLQVDHLQANLENWRQNPTKEIERVLGILSEARALGIKNIDIDGSTLTDLSKSDMNERLKENIFFTRTVLENVSDPNMRFGVEVGHIGQENTTSEEVEFFLHSLLPVLDRVTKVAIQTGTTHGGKVDDQGKVLDMTVDLSVINKISQICHKYQLSGVVQHGASTLPVATLQQLGKVGVVEVHLATIWQNLFFENCPTDLKAKINSYTLENFITEKKEYWTQAQLLYRMRKKSLGYFREQINNLSSSDKEVIYSAWREHFITIAKALKINKR